MRLPIRDLWRIRLLLFLGLASSSSSKSSSDASRSFILLTAALAVFLLIDLRTLTSRFPSEPWDEALSEPRWGRLFRRDALLLRPLVSALLSEHKQSGVGIKHWKMWEFWCSGFEVEHVLPDLVLSPAARVLVSLVLLLG